MSGAPSWYAAGARPVMFTHTKAFSAGFDPSSLERPFLVGSDYDGLCALSAEGLLDYGSPYADALEQSGYGWLFEWAGKVARGEDFTLDELRAAAAALR